jgi:hypothetical protein
MPRVIVLRTPRRHRGAAALITVMLLLLVAGVVALYLNRTLIVDHRTSVNQMRSTQALEAAEAGLEWAIAMVNSPLKIGADCRQATTGTASFRSAYLLTGLSATPRNTDFLPASHMYPGCRLTTNGTLACNCPTVTSTPGTPVYATLDASETPSFTVHFEPVAGHPDAVRITSQGCTASSSACTPPQLAQVDAHAQVTAIVKLREMLVPATPMVCGRNCVLSGAYNVINTHVPTNGVLINAGSSVTTGEGVTLETLQGSPTANAVIANDPSLAALVAADPTCSNSVVFKTYFGFTIDDYRTSPETKVLSCSSASDCDAKLITAYNEGWRAFYLSSDVTIQNGSTFGSQDEPVILVTPNALNVRGTWDVYGLVFSNIADLVVDGSGTVNIHGSQVTCGDYYNNGHGTTVYDAKVMDALPKVGGPVGRVPGSWKDF